MTSVERYECGEEVSDTATMCTHCGADNPTKNSIENTGETIIVVAMAVAALFGLAWAATLGTLPAS